MPTPKVQHDRPQRTFVPGSAPGIPDGGLRVVSTDHPESVPGLRDGWRSLAEARRNPFMTPEWFDAWRAMAPESSRPFVIAVRRGPDVVGVLPLVVASGRFGDRVRLAGEAFGDCFHPACRAEDEEVVARMAGEVLASRGWNSLELRHALVDSRWHETLTSRAGAAGAVLVGARNDLPYVDFGARDWDAFLGSRSRNFRKGLWRSMRQLQAQGDVAFRIADAEHLESDLRSLFELHDRRWGARSSFLNAKSVAFHTGFASLALERGWLRLGSLELDGRTVASTLGWRIGDRFLEFQRGYEPDLSRFALGKLVMGEMLRTTNEEGVRIYDQLLGDEHYKLQIADGVRQVETIRVGRSWHPGAAAVRAESLARDAYARAPEVVRVAVRKRRRPEHSMG